MKIENLKLLGRIKDEGLFASPKQNKLYLGSGS